MQYIYQEKQIVWWLVVPFSIILFFLILALFIATASESAKLGLVVSIVIMILILINFYQLKISVSQHYLKVAFGQGLFKKTFGVKNINPGRFSIVKLPWYYGMGWKYDFSGHMFFSTRPGQALSFQLKGSFMQYRIVANDNTALKAAISKAISLN